MALREADRTNFNTLLRAAHAGDLALIESRDKATGEYRALIAAIGRDGDQYLVTPFGHLATGNPYAQYVDPTLDTLPEGPA
jgi:hypothetical protein